MAELRKSHSNYILRRKRQLTSKGGIYERDWMTVSEMDGFAPGTLPVYASGNFKMTINNEHGGKKKYSFANWIVNDSGSTDWTLSVITEEQLKIKSDLIKPNYTSILDFAYYGSAVELIHGTVNDMIMKYPGELYLTGKPLQYATNKGDFAYIENVVENPFSIDVFSEYVNSSTVENPYRYMALSWDKYEAVKCDSDDVDKITTSTEITNWAPGKKVAAPCNNGDIVFSGATLTLKNGGTISFKGVYVNGEIYLSSDKTDWHIRLKEKYIDEIFETFDGFEKVLLNRDTKPKYKAKFYTPRETEKGVITHLRAYVWWLRISLNQILFLHFQLKYRLN